MQIYFADNILRFALALIRVVILKDKYLIVQTTHFVFWHFLKRINESVYGTIFGSLKKGIITFEGPFSSLKTCEMITKQASSSNYIFVILVLRTMSICFLCDWMHHYRRGAYSVPPWSQPRYTHSLTHSLAGSLQLTLSLWEVWPLRRRRQSSRTLALTRVCVRVFVLWLWQTLDLTTQSLGAHVNMTQKGSEGTSQNRNKQFKPKLNPHRETYDGFLVLGTLSCSVKCFVI